MVLSQTKTLKSETHFLSYFHGHSKLHIIVLHQRGVPFHVTFHLSVLLGYKTGVISTVLCSIRARFLIGTYCGCTRVRMCSISQQNPTYQVGLRSGCALVRRHLHNPWMRNRDKSEWWIKWWRCCLQSTGGVAPCHFVSRESRTTPPLYAVSHSSTSYDWRFASTLKYDGLSGSRLLRQARY